MQNAPSVVYPVGHSSFYRRVLVVTGLAAALFLFVSWMMSWLASPWNTPHLLWVSGMAIWAIWAVLTSKYLPPAPSGSLHWDAQAASADLKNGPGAWMWRASDPALAPRPLRIALILDGQNRLLVRARGLPGVGLWLWLERRHSPERWDDLRRALTAHGVRS
jgi:hypothetical protein